jgi:hypothetical protein
MDTKQLITDAKARFKHNSAKAYLKDKYESKLIVADQGGLWKATPELIAFLSISDRTNTVLLDTYQNPVQVEIRKLEVKLRETYNTVMEQWHTEWKELEKNR